MHYFSINVTVVLLVMSAAILVHSAPVETTTVTLERQGRSPEPQCDPGEDDCSKCYDLLANELIVSDKNRFNMQKAFFPPHKANPVFVTVRYHFIRNNTGPTNFSATNPDNTRIWFWTQSFFYLFQPIQSLQLTSLLFSDTLSSSSVVDLYLQPECNQSSIEMMQLLTQRVSTYDITQWV